MESLSKPQDLGIEACNNFSLQAVLTCFSGLDSEARPNGFKLGLLGKGTPQKIYMLALGHGMSTNEVALNIRNHLKLVLAQHTSWRATLGWTSSSTCGTAPRSSSQEKTLKGCWSPSLMPPRVPLFLCKVLWIMLVMQSFR